MENNDSTKPQQTGGLKLMTVFIAVLALHVLVIGGITVYHLMSGSSTDTDFTSDKHKTVKALSDGDAPAPDNNVDKPSVAATTNSAPADATPPPADQTAQTTPAPTPAPSTAATKPTAQTPSGPVQAPAGENAPIENPTLVSSGPVKMPVIQMAPQEQVAPSTSLGGAGYVVKSHDSLAKIAHQHHTTVAKLKAANSLNSDMLHIGQKLVIPAKGELASLDSTAPATAPTILDDSAPAAPVAKHQKAAKTASALAAAPVAPATPAAAPAMKASGHKIYTVMKGDTLTKIAHHFKTTPTAIMTANSITDARKLSIGQKLKIPSTESRSATTAEPATPATAPAAESEQKTSAQLANFVR